MACKNTKISSTFFTNILLNILTLDNLYMYVNEVAIDSALRTKKHKILCKYGVQI